MFKLSAASFYEPILGPVLKSLRQELMLLANVQDSDMYLDCCCGAGGLLKLLSTSIPHGTYLGLDLSKAMLKQAKHNAPGAKILCADASKLPYASKTFDIASICMALHAMPLDIAKVSVQELCRVSKRVLIADYCLVERNIYFPASFATSTVEYLVGGEHYQCYKEFMRLGGLEGFLQHMGYAIKLRRHVLGGAGLIVDVMD